MMIVRPPPPYQGFIQDFDLGGGGEKIGSRMIVVCETHACLLGGSGGMFPRKINLYLPQIASDAVWDKISEHFDDTYLCSVTCK